MNAKELIQEMITYLEEGRWKWLNNAYGIENSAGCLLQLSGHLCWCSYSRINDGKQQDEAISMIAKAIDGCDATMRWSPTAVVRWNDTVCQSQEQAIDLLKKALTL